jgi:hypothetical protein
MQVLWQCAVDHFHDLAIWAKASSRDANTVSAPLNLNRPPGCGHAVRFTAAPLSDSEDDLTVSRKKSSARQARILRLLLHPYVLLHSSARPRPQRATADWP